jgi:hypothetical protein
MFDKLDRKFEDMVTDIVAALAGIGLFVMPWLLGFATATAAAWNAWIVGAAVLVVALFALYQVAQWQPWAYLLLGLWAIAAPWLLGFPALAVAMYSHLVAGIVVVVIAAIELWFGDHSRPMSRA